MRSAVDASRRPLEQFEGQSGWHRLSGRSPRDLDGLTQPWYRSLSDVAGEVARIRSPSGYLSYIYSIQLVVFSLLKFPRLYI